MAAPFVDVRIAWLRLPLAAHGLIAPLSTNAAGPYALFRFIEFPNDLLNASTGADGEVKYTSAHVDYAESEFIVRSGHSCQMNPLTIEEVPCGWRGVRITNEGCGFAGGNFDDP